MSKNVRNYREFMARKRNHPDKLTDVFNNLFIRRDAVIHGIMDTTRSIRNVSEKMFCLCEDDFILSIITV